MGRHWRIEMFGGLRLSAPGPGASPLRRFRSQSSGTLLAYLALAASPVWMRPREELVELFWPESEPERGRASLRTALASLRRQLEPPGVQAGIVLVSDRACVGLNPEAVSTDVREFEAAARRAGSSGGRDEAEETVRSLRTAADLYRGELLPGCYDDWLLLERERLAAIYHRSTVRLLRLLEDRGEVAAAIEYARRLVAADPTREDAHCELVHLLASAGDARSALRQYRLMERVLASRLDASPGPRARGLLAEVERALREAPASAGEPERIRGSSGFLDPGRAAEGPGREHEPVRMGAAAAVDDKPRPDGPGFLPVPLSRFYGREAEIDWIVGQLDPDRGPPAAGSRLVTLTGPGGIGKTRLAVEAAGRLWGAYSGAVWFVDLEELDPAWRLGGCLAAALGLVPGPGVDRLDQVARECSLRPCLLVLDGFEHLVEEGAPVLAELLCRAPGLRFLVTSRRRLHLPGECRLPVRPLPTPNSLLPPPGAAADPDGLVRLASCDSVRLLADRIRAVHPDFQLTARNAGAVAALCDRLEGIPLAIELAAARAHLYSLPAMLGELRRRFDFLVGRRRDVADRHRTLYDAIDWSCRLLTPEARRFFIRLSVFRGGWSCAAAAAIAAGEGGPAAEPAACLDELVDGSLVQAWEVGGEQRFGMPETLREFAEGQLAGDEREALAREHANYFMGVVGRGEAELFGREQVQWFERLEREHDNLRAALAWCYENDGAAAVRLAGRAWRFWLVRSHLEEGRRHLDAALACDGSGCPLPDRAEALLGAGVLARNQGDGPAAAALLEASLEAWTSSGDRLGTARAMANLGIARRNAGNLEEARRLIEQSLGILRALDRPRFVAGYMVDLAEVLRRQGAVAAARELLEESLALARTLADTWGVGISAGALGAVYQEEGQPERAARLFQEALALADELGDRRGTVNLRLRLADLAWRRDDGPTARALLRECMPGCRQFPDLPDWHRGLAVCGELALAASDLGRAARLLAASAGGGCDGAPGVSPAAASLWARLEAELGPAGLFAAWRDGAAMGRDHALALALAALGDA